MVDKQTYHSRIRSTISDIKGRRLLGKVNDVDIYKVRYEVLNWIEGNY
jgi:hypothetical protein